MAMLSSRQFAWICAATLASLGTAPHVDAAVSAAASEQPAEINSIPERLRIVRERLGAEQRQNTHHERTPRFTQWYKG
jgi:hypothetical protein